jgi:hypothetical protein
MSITKRERELYTEQHIKAKFKNPEEENEYAKENTRICSKCNEEKNLTEYAGNTSGSDAFASDGYRLRRPECKCCGAEATQGKNEAIKLAKKLGIPYRAPEGTKCAICDKPPKKGDLLVFDHCHTSKKFRGYLHNSCNRSLGVLGDDVQGLVKCLNFLLKSEYKMISQDQLTGIVSACEQPVP